MSGDVQDTHDAPPPGRRVRFIVALVACALVELLFLALGAWQVQRLSWKQDLIARITQRTTAQPMAAPGPADWSQLSREGDEYRRVQLRGQYAFDDEALVRASTEFGTGYWVMTPLRLEDGFWVWINRGFVPAEMRDRASRAASETSGPQSVLGLLRVTEPNGSLLQTNQPVQDRWYSRDVQALTAARHLAPASVAPYFVDAVAVPGAAADTWPRAGLTVLSFANNHLEYALTWFALAALLAGGVAYALSNSERQPG